ncbi:uncharacterized protein MYCFIDRAFT_78469 [Pseudocercospora fijiensis CIRAD86]|uniref:RING-type domain-containing protein n=1 Tax=Pseudocercospora fijiensis (strain CIRAD86) TaxID=383855 RepID=N1QA52_PSEFD|nr:uncharacterized protein MYCFIDRAFT_78469 [Pseudocercospora fijiensis CIRAD86]EME89749.1 hypothetical protein MYCFIDRAFT_78469 [Pseudocercospora fijiensis CIRAD86]
MERLINPFTSFTTSDRRPNNSAGASQPDSQPQHIECAACFDDCTDKHVQVAGDHLCSDCFETGYVPQFQDALKDESKYPVKYGTTVLEPSHYPEFFDPAFLTSWRSKEEEYTTPVKFRLYCKNSIDDTPTGKRNRNGTSIMTQHPCGHFLGTKTLLSSSSPTIPCQSCNHLTCTRCSQPRSSSSTHECPATEEEEDNAFEGLTQGLDYQICPLPTCRVKMSLQDGCNGVRCAFCRTDFCFICGEKSSRGHWDAGQENGCPRFGTKGSRRAIFDDPNPHPPANERMLREGLEMLTTEQLLAMWERMQARIEARNANNPPNAPRPRTGLENFSDQEIVDRVLARSAASRRANNTGTRTRSSF